MVLAAEKALADTKEQIKALRRQARQAATLEEQHEIQEKIQKLERQQRRQRQEIFKVEDEIMEKRDALIDRSRSGWPSAPRRRRSSRSAGRSSRRRPRDTRMQGRDTTMSQKYEKLKPC